MGGSKHTPSEVCDCGPAGYIHHCAAQLPEAINTVAQWVSENFGQDGWMVLSRREGYAFDLFARLAQAGLQVKVLSKRKDESELAPNRPYLPGVNQCPSCNVGGCQGCDGNGH
jgi:hypothetical protein